MGVSNVILAATKACLMAGLKEPCVDDLATKQTQYKKGGSEDLL